ncbi:MAG: DNA alkylation repair protein [Chloroflexota bacterium]|jgi:hypothetical protein
MPAVSLSRLRSQIYLLNWQYTRPLEFTASLRKLLEQYADLTYRPADISREAVSFRESYHVPPVVMTQLELALSRLASETAPPGLALAETLWRETRVEPRLLALHLLGSLPLELHSEVTKRIDQWAREETDKQLLAALFEKATRDLRRCSAQVWLNKVREWLSAPSALEQKIGLLALIPLIEDRAFENLPVIFNACTPLFQSHPKALQSELRAVLVCLGRRSPTEVIYYIRQLIGSGASEDLLRLIRRSLPDLPVELQSRLRPMLPKQARA